MQNVRKNLLVLSLYFSCTYAFADLESQLVQSSGKNQSIAFWVNGVEDNTTKHIMENVQAIVQSDLTESGEWQITPVQYSQPSFDVLATLQRAQHDYAVYLYVHTDQVDNADIDVFIYNLHQHEEFSQPVFVGSTHIPFVSYQGSAHALANTIFKTIYGYAGNFLTKIAYVSERHKPGMQPIYNLVVADHNGKHGVSILQSYSPILGVSWSPDATKLAYALVENGRSIIYIQDILTGKRHQVTETDDFAIAPNWSQDGQTLIFSRTLGDESHVYTYRLDTNATMQITNAPALDSEPVFAAIDDVIFFTSNRSGSTQIYKRDKNTNQVERVTFDGDYNARPQIIRANEHIAMLHGRNEKLSIALFSPQENTWQTITHDGDEETLSLAPSGEFCLFASHYAGRSILNIVSLDGSIRWRLPDLSGDVQEPTWSPMLSVVMYNQLSHIFQNKEA